MRGRGAIASGITVLSGLPCVDRAERLGKNRTIQASPPDGKPRFRVNQRVKLLEPCMT
jgi:hypothetical protein